MRLSCPNCHAVYAVPENLIPRREIVMECSSCDHQWLLLLPNTERMPHIAEIGSAPQKPEFERSRPGRPTIAYPAYVPKDYRKFIHSDMTWPALAVIVLGVVGFPLVSLDYRFLWIMATGLVLVGSFLPPVIGALTGLVMLVGAIPWFVLSFQGQLFQEEVFVALALFPALPLFLGAARLASRQGAQLKMLIDIPEVRASMDVSDWSLLPTPRALDRRLQLHNEEQRRREKMIPAILFRITIENPKKTSVILGEDHLREMVASLSMDLRNALRRGDMITEDVRISGNIYILTFPNPEYPDNETVLCRKVTSVLRKQTLPPWRLASAVIPKDGERLQTLRWTAIE